MRGRPRWLGFVEPSRDECLNAVEFYNRPGSRRPLEAFLVHMHIAWVYLLQAEFEQGDINYYYLSSTTPRRYVKVDGERKSWAVSMCRRTLARPTASGS